MNSPTITHFSKSNKPFNRMKSLLEIPCLKFCFSAANAIVINFIGIWCVLCLCVLPTIETARQQRTPMTPDPEPATLTN